MSGEREYLVRPTLIPQLDADHWQLWLLLRRLHLSLGSPHQVGHILQDLVVLAKAHFAREERLFQRISFTKTEQHLAEHQELLARLQTEMQPLASELGQLQGPGQRHQQINLHERIAGFMMDWLIWHTNGADQQYVHHIQALGLDPTALLPEG